MITFDRRKLAVGLAMFGAGLFLLFQAAALVFHLGEKGFRPLTRFVLPAASVEGNFVSYRRVSETAHGFVALGISPSYDEAFPLALQFAARDERVQAVLDEHASAATDAASLLSDTQRDTLRTAGFSDKHIAEWFDEPFERAGIAERVVREKSGMNDADKIKIASVQEKLDFGMPFADVARYFSEDGSAVSGGDLGVLYIDELPEWLKGIENHDIGDNVSNLEGTDAFWIIRVVDKGTDGDERWVSLRGIAVNKSTLGDVLQQRAADHPAWVFVW